jgi:hypothetical protein
MLGQATAAAAAGSLDTTLNSTNYQFLGDIASIPQYVLPNINFSIVRMDMPAYFYEVMANVLASGVVYQLYYPNCQIFTGQSTKNKSGTTRSTISTRSLDSCIGTFQVANRDTVSAVLNSSICAASAGEFGNASSTASNLIDNVSTRVFNQSEYLARNGSGVRNGTWYAGNDKLNTETPLQMYNSLYYEK